MSNLREVAKEANVSVATASRVLNGSSHPVSSEVREKVTATAQKLGYTPSAAAQSLRHKKSRIIGVIASDIMDPYFAQVTRGIEIEAASYGFVTVLANANRDATEELHKFQVLREHRASGIIFCGSDIAGSPGVEELCREVNQAIEAGTQVVSLAPRQFSGINIVIDNAQTARELTDYMISLGHHSVGFVGGIPGLHAAEQRIAGYKERMFAHSLPPLVYTGGGMSQEAGLAAVRQMLDAGTLPQALVCSNDEVAIGVLAELISRGISVPAQVSVAGIGGTRGSETFGLTTMRLPLMELGASAAKLITQAKPGADVPLAPGFSMHIGRTTAPAR